MTQSKKGRARLHEPELDSSVAVMVEAQPPVDAAAVLAQQRLEEQDREMQELLDSESHARIDNMTKDQLAAHAMRMYGVSVDTSLLKSEVTEKVRHLMRIRG